MKKVLCPTDFSNVARNAIVYAAKLCKALGADLTLFNVQSLFELAQEEFLHGKSVPLEAVAEKLEQECLEIRQTFRVPCYAEVVSSRTPLAKVIRDRGRHSDLIVMGSNGPDDFFQFVAGSNTFNTIKQASVPVLMVPMGCLYNEVKSLVYAFDYLTARTLPLAQLMDWVKSLNCNVKILQVMEEAQSKEVDLSLKAVQKLVKKQHGDEIALEFDTIRSSGPAQGINEYMARNKADLLVLCTQHRGFFSELLHRSTVKQINIAAAYPVLLLHA